jgi:predicted helicase
MNMLSTENPLSNGLWNVYAVTTRKESGIKNDPNDWAIEHENLQYILGLLLSVITVSVKTADIINKLPKMEWE